MSSSSSSAAAQRRRWLVGGSVLVAGLTMTALLVYNPWSNGLEPQEGKRDAFASDRNAKAGETLPFDGKRAIGYLEELCKIGPRISGTEGMAKQQKYLEKHFEELGGKVFYQRFTAKQNSQRDEVEMANMVVSWFPEREKRVIICSHYDTRPIADQEADRRKWHDDFVSANDGGSGVVLMMEMAHAMKGLKTNVGVDFVFFDGEEYVFGRDDLYFFGSKHFGNIYRKNKDKVKYQGAVLLDMVGGKNAHFAIDPESYAKAGKVVEEIWSIAAEQKCEAFLHELGEGVEDDHLALQRVGIKAIDIIEWPNQQSPGYKHWHRLSDTPDKCSPAMLSQVAKVLGVWLQRIK
jgi:hypothetical protein